MEVNREEAQRCLAIAQRHRSTSNLPSALKFAKKSVTLYSTPEGEALVTILEREISTGGSSSSGPSENGSASGSKHNGAAKASGVEEHATHVHARPGHGAAASKESAPKKREYTAKQMEVVKRVKTCRHHEYYEILAVERTCEENDVKKAYKKLALALHPDKNGAPGADEAFKMVSKAFQILSDADMRAAFDSNPGADPTQRGGGMASRGGGGMRGFQNGGFQGDLNPEDLFNMFFGGGGGQFGGQANVFTFGGPGGFQAQFGGPRRQRRAANDEPTSPFFALLPVILLFLFAAISIIPAMLSGPHVPDPDFAFEPSYRHDLGRTTWHRNVHYWVNRGEWEKSQIWDSVPEDKRGRSNAAAYSSKVRSFERGIENRYVRGLQDQCEYFDALQQQQIQSASGFFGIGADFDKIKLLRAEKSPACEELRTMGMALHRQY